MKRLNRLILALSACFACALANAVYIVDTGPEPNGFRGGISLFNDGNGAYQFVAAQFMTEADWTLNSVEGWMSNAAAGETATAVIYSDESGLPGVELFAASFTATGGDASEWEGAFELDWYLSSGTYWVAMEVRDGQTMDAAMPSNVVNPLDLYAWIGLPTNNWQSNSVFDMGFRIDATPVPLPAALPLFAGGVIALAGLARRKRMQ